MQRLENEKAALEEQISSLKIEHSDLIWSLESRLLKSESDRTLLESQENDLRSDLDLVTSTRTALQP